MTNEINRFLPKLDILIPEDATEGETTDAISKAEVAASEHIPNRFYQDGEPSWPNAPTPDDADSQRRFLAKRLRRFAGSFPGAAELADRLISCKPDNRCLSGACPVCMRAAQRTFVGLLSACCETDEVVAVSMISRNWQAPVGQLQSLDLNDIYFAFEDIYGHHYFGSSYCIALGLDVSLNDDTRKGHGVFGKFSFTGLRASMTKANLQMRFARTFMKQLQRQ